MSTALITAFKNGQCDAFERLFHEYQPQLIHHAQRLFRGRGATHSDAEETASSVLLELHRCVQGKRPFVSDLSNTESLIRVLNIITNQKVVRRLRFLSRYKRQASRSVSLELDPADPICMIDRIVNRAALQSVLDKLDPPTREVADHLIQGKTRPEIARLMNCGVRTIFRRQQSFKLALQEAGLLK